MAREYLYHVWDDPKFDGKPPLSAVDLDVPRNKVNVKPTEKETKRFYSLKRDLEVLRKTGAAKGIVDPKVVALSPTSLEGRELFAIKIGKGSHKALLLGCHHSREWISVEVPYYLAEYLVNNYTDTPTTEEQKRIKHLVDNRQIWVVPMCNPDGHAFTTREQRFWRPNRRVLDFPDAVEIKVDKDRKRTIKVPAGKKFTGVDINRNYASSDWGEETYDSNDPGASRATSRDPAEGGMNSVFCGLSAGSEPETQAVSALIEREKFAAMLTYHSQGQDYIFPDQVTGNVFLTDLKDGMSKLVSQYGNPYNFRASANYRYRVSGDMMVFFTEKSPLRPAYVPEMRPLIDAAESITFSGLPESQIQGTLQENLAAALAMINAAPFDKEPHDVSVRADGKSPLVQVVRSAWRSFEGWKPTL